jgi:hypothetical protein
MEKIHTGRFVVVNSSNSVELRLASGGILATFSSNAELAVLNGNIIQVNLKTGQVVFYKLTNDGYSVTGPYLSL